MDESILHIGGVIFNSREPDVGFVPEPDGEGVPGCDEDPLSNIELPVLDEHWVLNVLHGYPVTFSITVVDDLDEGVEDLNTSTSR